MAHVFRMVAAAALLVALAPVARAQNCDDFNECTGLGMCLPDGTCEEGPPLPDGTACDDSNPCTSNTSCLGGVCMGGQLAADGTPCRLIDSACFTEGQCQAPFPGVPFSLCVGSMFRTCPNDPDPCKQSFCNPENGQCESFPRCPFEGFDFQCADATCSVVNGVPTCTYRAKNEGGVCNEFEQCSSSRCRAGDCVAANGGPTPTPMPTATPTPIVEGCVGDCNDDGEVTIDDIILMVSIAQGVQSIDDCPQGDSNGDGEITIDEILQAVNNALGNC
jgi:hypothetical protein